MRYIGGKTELLGNIRQAIGRRPVLSFIDIFAGSGVVSNYMAKSGIKVISNDALYFSYVLNRGLITMSKRPAYKNLHIKDPIRFLNNLKIEDSHIALDRCFIWKNYSPHNGCSRMYFQEKNALHIDIIRITIERWFQNGLINTSEYYYLLSRLISAVPFVSNIAGVYGAYLKHWDPRSYKNIELKDFTDWQNINKNNVVLNLDYKQALSSIRADLLYADPPYNARQYLPNYHILETIAKYDYPNIHGVSGVREYTQTEKSDFCSASKVRNAFEELIKRANVEYIIISYNNEGLITTDELSTICCEYAKTRSFRLIQIPYRRYRSHEGKDLAVNEQLYVFRKK